jgi:lipopolysaccharide export LptBFGC system permease protein LptF
MKTLKTILIIIFIIAIVVFVVLYWIDSNSSIEKKVKLSKTFQNDELGFSIGYPADWEYTQPNAWTVVFSGKQDSEAYYSTVNIQSIASKQAGGKYGTVEEAMGDFKKQFLTAPQAKIIEEGASILTQADGTKYEGRYLIVTYLLEGAQLTQQDQRVFPRKDGLGFYAWAYTSPKDQYDKYFPIAESMLESIQLFK